MPSAISSRTFLSKSSSPWKAELLQLSFSLLCCLMLSLRAPLGVLKPPPECREPAVNTQLTACRGGVCTAPEDALGCQTRVMELLQTEPGKRELQEWVKWKSRVGLSKKAKVEEILCSCFVVPLCAAQAAFPLASPLALPHSQQPRGPATAFVLRLPLLSAPARLRGATAQAPVTPRLRSAEHHLQRCGRGWLRAALSSLAQPAACL